MINQKQQITEVLFATEKKGCIAVGVQLNQLVIEQIAEGIEKEIGGSLEKLDCQELPKVILDFTLEESVDVMIKALERIKENIRGPYYGLALAC